MYTRGTHLWEKCKCKKTGREASNFRGKHPTKVFQAKSEHFSETVMFLRHIVLLLQKKQKILAEKSRAYIMADFGGARKTQCYKVQINALDAVNQV